MWRENWSWLSQYCCCFLLPHSLCVEAYSSLLKEFPICPGSALVRWCSAVVGTVLHSYFLLPPVVATALQVIPLTMLGDLVPGIFLPEPQALRRLWILRIEGSKERLENCISGIFTGDTFIQWVSFDVLLGPFQCWYCLILWV